MGILSVRKSMNHVRVWRLIIARNTISWTHFDIQDAFWSFVFTRRDVMFVCFITIDFVDVVLNWDQ